MGRVGDWVVSSIQLCTSCLSPSDDERPVKAKTRNPRRFWIITKVFRSKAVEPEKEIKISKTSDKNNCEAAKMKSDMSKVDGSLNKLRDTHLRRPLPVPSPSDDVMSTKTKSKKTKGTTACKGCVNKQHDPWKIRQRLSSKLQRDNKDSDVDDSALVVGGQADGSKGVLKRIDTEVRKKVDKVFGSSEYRNDVRSPKCDTANAEGRCRRTRKVSPIVPCHGLVDEEDVPKPSLDAEYGEKSIRSKKDKHRKVKRSRVNKDTVPDDGMLGESRRITEHGGCESHDDDDIVCGIPDISPKKTSTKVNEESKLLEADGYETHDDDDDIVFGIPDTISKASSAEMNAKKEKAQTDGYESHDDDDDIVFGKPDKYVESHQTSLAKTSDNKHSVDKHVPEKSGFAEIIKSMSETLGEMKRASTEAFYEKNRRDMVNMLSSGSMCRSSNLPMDTVGARVASQTHKPGYSLIIKELADRIGEMKSSGCDSQSRKHSVGRGYQESKTVPVSSLQNVQVVSHVSGRR